MKVVIGFSRGGTHLFWSILASHPQLSSPKREINDFVGRHNLGLVKKLQLETAAATKRRWLRPVAPFDFSQSTIHKGVSSWWKSNAFHALRRHDVLKYVELYRDLLTGPVVFLVKSPQSQYNSWFRRGASREQVTLAYGEHLGRWLNFSKYNPTVFIDYESFCINPLGYATKIWSRWGLESIAPETVTYAPKKSSFTPNLPDSHEHDRSWITVPIDVLTDELKSSLRHHIAVDIPHWIRELHESIDFLSAPHERWN